MSGALLLDTGAEPVALDDLERRLIDCFQRDLPLCPRPYAAMAERLGASEADVLGALARLREAGVLSRVGAVVAPHRAGWSTLAALAVPPRRLEAVAALVAAHPEVTHNYEREHPINLWFVVAAASAPRVADVLAAIEAETGLPVLDLPLVEAYHVDLGFPVAWR